MIQETLKLEFAEQWDVLTSQYAPDAIQVMLMNGHVAGLEKLWADAGLGRFNKVAFASALKTVLLRQRQVPEPMKTLMTTILTYRRQHPLMDSILSGTSTLAECAPDAF